MARIVIEQVFAQPQSDEDFAEATARLTPCLDARLATWRRSYVSADRLRMICEYDAPDAESVREGLRAAGIAFERVWKAWVFTAEDNPRKKEELAALLAAKKG